MEPIRVVSQELREAEREIDGVFRSNALLRAGFAKAAWRFMAANEERVMREIIRNDGVNSSSSAHKFAALGDAVVTQSKWPMRWLLSTCRPGGRIPETFNDDEYQAALDLAELGQNYSHFEAAFTYASLGVLTLTIEDHLLRSSAEFRGDTRYEAYDRLRHPGPSDPGPVVSRRLLAVLDSTVRVKEQWFFYDTGPGLIDMGLDVLSSTVDSRFHLPDHWTFSRFSLADVREVVRVMWVLAFLHFHARVLASRRGCRGLGYSRALLFFTTRELLETVRIHTKVHRRTIAEILSTLTFGARDQQNPDPALQPLIALTPRHLGIAPNLLLNSSFERNISVLLNRLSDDRQVYARLSKDREEMARDRVVREVTELGYRCWHGELSAWGRAGEVDLIITSDAERCCLALEMKAFIWPADPREVHERSLEIKRGIVQATEREVKTRELPEALHKALHTDSGYEVTWAVASETSIGAGYVQSIDIPVIQTQHLIDRLRHERRLTSVCDWLKRGAHLPIEGSHYKAIDFEAAVGSWRLQWYGLKCLSEDYI